MSTVSIIMTSYNKAKFIGKSIEGILNQTYKDFELFLMDDNSNKETQRVINQYLHDRRIKYIRSDIEDDEERLEKIRYAVLINKALRWINGKYVSYATDDNVYRPRRIEKMVEYLENNQEVNICYSSSRISYLNKSKQPTRVMVRKAKSILWIAPCVVDHCSVMHRASILPVIYEKWGSYWDEDPRFYLRGDAKFFWRLNHFWPFYPIREILDDNAITQESLHTQVISKNIDSVMKKLPRQCSCREMREQLKYLRSERNATK
ncbi:glycosyltransferase family 2 protein [Clostridiaceae bacterium M8S5]|nr:glycosyltransferase family 2 protein [Clostridiaceae bacterium M8S5]